MTRIELLRRTGASVRTLIDALRQHVETTPERMLYTFLRDDNQRDSLTFAELDDRAQTLAGAFLLRAKPGDRALMAYPPGLDFIEAFLGCLYAGIVAVPAYPPKRNRNAERVLAIAQDCRPQLILCTAETHSNMQAAFVAPIHGAEVLLTDEIGAGREGDLPDISPDRLAFLQYTSGSTADPMGVMVSHRNIVANERLIQRYFEFDQTSLVISWLPMFHDMGLIGALLAPLFCGFPVVLMAPNTFLREPFKWLHAVTEFSATTTGAPNFAYDLCVRKITAEQKRHLDLSSLKIAYNGAEPVRAATLERFSEAFAECGFRSEAWFPCYGLAETTLLVSGGPPLVATHVLTLDAAALEQHRILEIANGQPIVSCGQFGPDLEVRIVDPETGVQCPPDQIGEIWLHGASIAQGYYDRPEVTEAAFCARITGDAREWLRTGDYGFTRGGELYVTGRLKDMILIRGRHIYPQDVERAVERALPFVEANSCAAFSLPDQGVEQLGLLIEADRELVRAAKASVTDPAAAATLREHVARARQEVGEEFGIPVHALAFVRPGEFSRTSSGKVQRHRCREMLQNREHEFVFVTDAYRINAETSNSKRQRGRRLPGTLNSERREAPALADASGYMRRDGSPALRPLLHDTIVEWLRENEDQDATSIDDDASFMALGIDSVGAAEIALQIERATGLSLTTDTFYDYHTLRELTAYLGQKSPVTAVASPVAEVVRLQDSTGELQSRSEELKSHDFSYEPDRGNDKPRRGAAFLNDLRTRDRRVAELKARGLYFYDTPFAQIDGNSGTLTHESGERQRLIMLSSYSYLGLIGHAEVNEASVAAIQEFGAGAHGARLLAGNTSLHRRLERALAEFMQAEAAIVYGTGYVTNLASISALVGREGYVIGDELNHASIADGCTFSGGEFVSFRHNDLSSLEQRLQAARGRNTLVVVDGVYSMEGDIAPVPDIARLCDQYDALLMVDEAHSLGVIGKTGRGVQEHFDLPPDAIDLKMGTLSKALGSQGGFVAARPEVVSFLKHNSRGFVFSTATPAPTIAAALKSLEILQREPQRVARLQQLAKHFRERVIELGFQTTATETPIIPLLCGTEDKTLQMTAHCRARGLFVVPIFYPVVPMNAPRIRITLIATLTDEDIENALQILGEVGREVGVLP